MTLPDQGFTLIEIVISLLILSLAMLIATRLLLESQSHLLHASRQLLEPGAEQAVQQIRADLRTSAGYQRPLVPGWSRDPLVLIDHPAGVITYQKQGEELLRLLLPSEPDPELQQRLVLQQVTTWRWRPRGASIEIDLGHRPLGRLRQQTASGRWRDPVRNEIHRVFWVTPRARSGRSW